VTNEKKECELWPSHQLLPRYGETLVSSSIRKTKWRKPRRKIFKGTRRARGASAAILTEKLCNELLQSSFFFFFNKVISPFLASLDFERGWHFFLHDLAASLRESAVEETGVQASSIQLCQSDVIVSLNLDRESKINNFAWKRTFFWLLPWYTPLELTATDGKKKES
jgi:hypothetical protein